MKQYEHHCVIREGDMAGNDYAIDVTRWNYSNRCENCGEQLASIEELIEYMYEELTGEEQ